MHQYYQHNQYYQPTQHKVLGTFPYMFANSRLFFISMHALGCIRCLSLEKRLSSAPAHTTTISLTCFYIYPSSYLHRKCMLSGHSMHWLWLISAGGWLIRTGNLTRFVVRGNFQGRRGSFWSCWVWSFNMIKHLSLNQRRSVCFQSEKEHKSKPLQHLTSRHSAPHSAKRVER